MFESIETGRGAGAGVRVAGFLSSLAAHLVAAGGAILLPLLFLRILPETDLLAFLVAPPPLPAPPPPLPPKDPHPGSPRETGGARTTAAFAPPIVVPDGIAPPDDDPVPFRPGLDGGISPLAGGGAAGVPGGLPIAGQPPPPPAPPPPRIPQRVSTGVQESKLVHRVAPVYPVACASPIPPRLRRS